MSRVKNAEISELNKEFEIKAIELRKHILREHKITSENVDKYRMWSYSLLVSGSILLFLTEFIGLQKTKRSRIILGFYIIGGVLLILSLWANANVQENSEAERKLLFTTAKIGAHSTSSHLYYLLERSHQRLVGQKVTKIPISEQNDIALRLFERIGSYLELVGDVVLLFSTNIKTHEGELTKTITNLSEEFLEKVYKPSIMKDNSLSPGEKIRKLNRLNTIAITKIENFRNQIPSLIKIANKNRARFELIYYFAYILGTMFIVLPALFLAKRNRE